MNRSLTSVILGGFGNKSVESNTTSQVSITGTHTETTVDQVADLMVNSKSIIITPGEIEKKMFKLYLFIEQCNILELYYFKLI